MLIDHATKFNRTVEVDLLVVGGSFAGVSAACAAADEGLKVLLIEPRTYLGEEVTATGRMWLSSSGAKSDVVQPFSLDSIFGVQADPLHSDATEHALNPDTVKLRLEDELLNRDIGLLYQVRPIAWALDEHNGYTVKVIGKAGPMIIRTRRLIDATVHGLLARMTDNTGHRYDGREVRVRRVLEFIRVDVQKMERQPGLIAAPFSINVPAEYGGSVEVHQGYEGAGHILVVFAMNWNADTRVNARNNLEIQARLESRNLAKWLIEQHPSFSRARWVGSSNECHVPPLYRIAGADRSDELESKFRTANGIWIASGCGDISDTESEDLASNLGQCIELGFAIGVRAAKADGNVRAGSGSWRTSEPFYVDALVIGGGTSGVPAAISASEHGCSTLLVEMNPALGGAGTLGGVDSYWYGRRAAFNVRVSSTVAAEHRWMGIPENQAKWNLEAKMYVWLHLATRAGVDVVLHSVLLDLKVDERGKVTGAYIATQDGILEVNSRVIIDATGDGDVAVRAGADYVYGSDRDSVTMWYSMIPFPKPGQSKNNWTSTVDVDSAEDMTRSVVSARRRWVGHDHSVYIAPRETRHILGSVRLTLTDQLRFRQWPDVVNIAYSNHDIKGQSTSDWLRMGLIPPNLEVEIPLRALIPKQIDGVIVTGKAISATHDALPAIRMQADLENLGSVCGIIAGICRELDVEPRDVPIRPLQERLVQQGFLPEDVLRRTIDESPMSEEEMQQWMEQLDDAENLYDYSDMGFDEVRREPIPIVMVCTAGSDILPLLRQEAANPHSKRRLMVARALAWYGDATAAPILIQAINKYLLQDELPYRDSKIRNTQASPDQGAMPDLGYLLHTLAMARDVRSKDVLERAVVKLVPTMEKFTDNRSGIFHYVDGLCDIAEQLGDPRCTPSLQMLHQHELFRNRGFHGLSQPDYFEERTAYLELLIGRALARCGSKDGADILISYLNDSRRTLARHAYQELKDISGLDFGPHTDPWLAWLSDVEVLPVKPWISQRGAS